MDHFLNWSNAYLLCVKGLFLIREQFLSVWDFRSLGGLFKFYKRFQEDILKCEIITAPVWVVSAGNDLKPQSIKLDTHAINCQLWRIYTVSFSVIQC